jgi:hypothetical protein
MLTVVLPPEATQGDQAAAAMPIPALTSGAGASGPGPAPMLPDVSDRGLRYMYKVSFRSSLLSWFQYRRGGNV